MLLLWIAALLSPCVHAPVHALAAVLPAERPAEISDERNPEPKGEDGAELTGPSEVQVEAPLPLPGVIPEGTLPEVAELWQRFAAAQAIPGRPAGPLSSFDVQFVLRLRDGAQSNDLRARVRYLGPSFVRFGPSGRAELLRGPRGDFLVDGSEAVALRGREYAEDRRQLTQALALARSFAALADTSQLRLLSLAALDRPPPLLPARAGFQPRQLRWLELSTPDLRLFETAPGTAAPPQAGSPPGAAAAPAPQRVRLGLELESDGTPRLRCLELSPLEPGDPEGPPPLEHVVLLDGLRSLEGRTVPHTLLVFERGGSPPEGLTWAEIVNEPSLLRFWTRPRPTQEIYLESGSVRPTLTPRDFEP